MIWIISGLLAFSISYNVLASYLLAAAIKEVKKAKKLVKETNRNMREIARELP